MDEKLKYPIGKFKAPEQFTASLIQTWISTIAEFPEKLKKEVLQLDDVQLDTAYRPGGWTIRQVVHHCADSHLNSYIRFKLALTEDSPIIKPYFEERWAELPDALRMPVAPSISLLEGLHQRWGFLLNELTEEQLERCFIHPEHGNKVSLKTNIAIYAWHCNHHLAHITTVKAKLKPPL
jgi:hypothetical protein